MKITKELFGLTNEHKEVHKFTLQNDKDMTVSIIDYGGIVTSILVPDKTGNTGDVVLGFDNLDGYLGDHPYFGAIIGRFANRISGGRFTLNNQEYKLAVNQNPSHLHGGLIGFDKKIWTAKALKSENAVSLHLALESAHMEEGYPGNLMVEVIYTLNNSNELQIDYRARSDEDTIINLTNHSYFNLNISAGNIKNHTLRLDACYYTPVDEFSIPTGEIISVKDTAFDFSKSKKIGDDFDKLEMGYDHNFVLNKNAGEFSWFAKVSEAVSGRVMEVGTTEPGVQLYTSNYLNGIKGKGDMLYHPQSALCLETQQFPDSPNKKHFPSATLKKGEEYLQKTLYKFSVE